MVSNMEKYLSRVIYDGDFLSAEAKSSSRQKIVFDRKKLEKSRKANKPIEFSNTDYIPELNGPPTEYRLAFNLFSIVYWFMAEKQVPRENRENKVSVTSLKEFRKESGINNE